MKEYNDYVYLTRQYLKNYNLFVISKSMLEKDIRDKEKILSTAGDVGAAVARYGDAPAGGSAELNTVEADCERRLKLLRNVQEMKNDLSELIRLTDRIDTAFEAVDDLTRSIVKDYYMTGYSWDQIAMRYYYSARWCREKARKAVEDMAVVMFGIKARPMQMQFVFVQ